MRRDGWRNYGGDEVRGRGDRAEGERERQACHEWEGGMNERLEV